MDVNLQTSFISILFYPSQNLIFKHQLSEGIFVLERVSPTYFKPEIFTKYGGGFIIGRPSALKKITIEVHNLIIILMPFVQSLPETKDKTLILKYLKNLAT